MDNLFLVAVLLVCEIWQLAFCGSYWKDIVHNVTFGIFVYVFQGQIYVCDTTKQDEISVQLLNKVGYGKFIGLCSVASLNEYVVVSTY